MAETQKPWWRDSVLIFSRITIWVAVPVVISLFLGKFLDKKLGTTPWIFLILTGIAFFISIFGILKVIKGYMQDLQKEIEIKKQNNGNTTRTN